MSLISIAPTGQQSEASIALSSNSSGIGFSLASAIPLSPISNSSEIAVQAPQQIQAF